MVTQVLHHQTPLIYSQYLKNKMGKDVYFKVEALQPTGSFKIRGIGKLCQHYTQQGYTHFVASSGGNAGIAVAYAGMKLGIPTTVFIPTSSHQIYVNEIQSYGAQVIVEGAVWDDAHQAALSFVNEHKAAYIPPFDHPIIWSGHASMISEVSATGLHPDLVIVAVGGGGLACGVLQGMHQVHWEAVPLIAVETIGADAFHQSVLAKQRVVLKTITSKATSLGAKQIAERLFQWTAEHPIKNIVVSDENAEAGARAFAKDKRILVELSAGAPLSLVYQNHSVLKDAQSILVIVCGGVNTQFFDER
ncbi:L-threonine dehydratase biosynthetic IlvA [Legionella lansingensis]|uniref:L-serine ammonia-lyase n=1 Tax=Legionella lansingensis TaxID=45067 RepID=A0A0W0VTW0_9GAMM|nr:pyridoxal-phosphate dependent enzyme [Legionella lansingensis]KTD23458.1 L-threonine dehydratase biosynthetic IlvA [Legionella lansingensis]SNV50845.1 L-threonine dehydratase biosynthetic IlvA [Legionella lansingensis]